MYFELFTQYVVVISGRIQ